MKAASVPAGEPVQASGDIAPAASSKADEKATAATAAVVASSAPVTTGATQAQSVQQQKPKVEPAPQQTETNVSVNDQPKAACRQ